MRAAAKLLAKGGRDAVSTRAVSAAAGVQAPAIYRQFGDMSGLLHAAAHEIFEDYVRRKATREKSTDPIDDLRRGWDAHVAFGLASPAAYTLMYASSEGAPDEPAVREGHAILRALITRIAEAGRLRVPVEHAVRMVHAGGSGVTSSLIAQRPEERDLRVSDAMREAVISAITAAPTKEDARASRLATRAVALRAVLSEANEVLSAGERELLGEWLDRLARR